MLDSSTSTRLRRVAARIATDAIPLAIIWWLALSITPAEIVAAFPNANQAVFLPTCALSVVCWVLGR
jgi:hypothetical protein